MNMIEAFNQLHAQRDDVNTTHPERCDFVPSSMVVVRQDIADHYTEHAARWSYYEDILDEYGADDTDLFDGHFDPIDQPIGRYLLVQRYNTQVWITTWETIEDVEHYLDVDDSVLEWTIERIEDMDRGGFQYQVKTAFKVVEIEDQ